jgi:hypothetical protein
VDEWIKKCVMYTHGILFISKKKWNPVLCRNMDGTTGHYIKWNKKPRTEIQLPHVFIHSRLCVRVCALICRAIG